MIIKKIFIAYVLLINLSLYTSFDKYLTRSKFSHDNQTKGGGSTYNLELLLKRREEIKKQKHRLAQEEEEINNRINLVLGGKDNLSSVLMPFDNKKQNFFDFFNGPNGKTGYNEKDEFNLCYSKESNYWGAAHKKFVDNNEKIFDTIHYSFHRYFCIDYFFFRQLELSILYDPEIKYADILIDNPKYINLFLQYILYVIKDFDDDKIQILYDIEAILRRIGQAILQNKITLQDYKEKELLHATVFKIFSYDLFFKNHFGSFILYFLFGNHEYILYFRNNKIELEKLIDLLSKFNKIEGKDIYNIAEIFESDPFAAKKKFEDEQIRQLSFLNLKDLMEEYI